MNAFPHPIVLQQISSQQPRILIWLLLLCVATWFPTVLSRALLQWPLFAHFVNEHPSFYSGGFFAIQMSLIFGTALYVATRYARALWTPQPSFNSRLFSSLLILVPVSAYYLSQWISALPAIALVSRLAESNEEARRVLASLHQQTWRPLAYDSSWSGVVCSTILSLAGPFLEESLFAGLLANRVAKHFGVAAAVFVTPLCFTLAHLPRFDITSSFLPLFFCGLTYTLVRFHSGSLLMAIASHIIINTIIFVPKWIIAIMHFKYSS